MQGYKTIVVAGVSVVAGVATMLGVTLDPSTMQSLADNINTVIGGGMTAYGLIMVILRALTKSPIFTKVDK